MDDYKNYSAPLWWRMNKDRVWAAIFISCLLVASFIPNNAEPTFREAYRVTVSQGILNSDKGNSPTAPCERDVNRAGSAPYTPCPKTKRGKWLKWEIAHQVKDGYQITCVYDDDALVTLDDVNL